MITIDEKVDSRSGSLKDSTFELLYVAWGSGDEAELIAAARGVSPTFLFIDGVKLWRQNIAWQVTGHEMWDVVVPYEKQPKEEGSVRWGFDSTGGTATIKCAKESIARYPGTAPNHHGSIGVTKDGVEGVEIVVPAAKLHFTYTNPSGVVTMEYAKQLIRYTGYTNDDTFREWNRGELLYIGAVGSDGSDAPAEVTYNMIGSSDETGITFGDIAGIEKKGHEAAWVYFKAKPEDGQATTQPLGVYIERVYDFVNFPTIFGWS